MVKIFLCVSGSWIYRLSESSWKQSDFALGQDQGKINVSSLWADPDNVFFKYISRAVRNMRIALSFSLS